MNIIDHAAEIIDCNNDALYSFFRGEITGEFLDGTSYQLYLDINDDKIFENREASSSTWLSRDDDSLFMIYECCGYADGEAPFDIDDYYDSWEREIARKIQDVLWDRVQRLNEA